MSCVTDGSFSEWEAGTQRKAGPPMFMNGFCGCAARGQRKTQIDITRARFTARNIKARNIKHAITLTLVIKLLA
jgi:hypothetical protein